MYRSSFEVLKSRKDENGEAVSFWERLPFNPLLYGWNFKEACCCNVKFEMGDKLMSVTDKGMTFVKMPEKIVAFNTPKNQLEFIILHYGTNSDSFVSGAEPVEATDSH